jgi:hypothetical protein
MFLAEAAFLFCHAWNSVFSRGREVPELITFFLFAILLPLRITRLFTTSHTPCGFGFPGTIFNLPPLLTGMKYPGGAFLPRFLHQLFVFNP